MDDIISVLSKFVKQAVAPVELRVGYLSYKKDVKILEENVMRLVKEREKVQVLLAEAMHGGEEIEDEVEDWIGSVDEMIKMGESFLSEEQHRRNKFCNSPFINRRLRTRAMQLRSHSFRLATESKFKLPSQVLLNVSTAFSVVV